MEEEKYHEEIILSPKYKTPVENSKIEKLIGDNRRRVLKTFLALGPTRMGKSSLINALAGKPICNVGKSSGGQHSTTS